MGVLAREGLGSSGNLSQMSAWFANPNGSENAKIWNYGRYAYITVRGTGKNNAGLCNSSGGILGDSQMSGETYGSLKSRDGDRDIPNPILESVRISNDGATDVTDASLFDIDVSFKCFSKGQLATFENIYFVPGAEVFLEFGYKGLGMGGSLFANVYNFGFSLDASGVYSCNMKLTGMNRFAAILKVTNSPATDGTTSTDKEGNEFKGDSLIGELYARFTKTFPDFEESSFIQKPSTKDFVDDGKAKYKSGYAVANIQTKGGFDFNAGIFNVDTDDMFVKYCSFQELINVCNWLHKGSGFSWGFGDANGAFIPEMCSADPSVVLLDGEMANYGGDDDTANNLKTGIGFSGNAKDILISMEYIGTEIKKLEERSKEDKEEKGEESVNNFLRNVCATIKDLTGGLYPLIVWNNGRDGVFKIINERAEHDKGITGYQFTLHDIGSVVTSINMSSNMDSEMSAAALVSNRSGDIPKGAFDNLFPGCSGPTTTPPSVSLADIKEKKEILGGGFSPERCQDLKTVLSAYVSRNPGPTKTDAGYRYMIDLSVQHYGCWGAEITDSFTFDGLPKQYQGAGKYFAVGKIEHTFDGQGGWTTDMTGFFKIDA